MTHFEALVAALKSWSDGVDEFISGDERRIKICVSDGFEHTAIVTVDGQKIYEITGGDYIEIEKTDSKVKMLKIHSKNFFTILRNKIYDRKED